jgi:hypothetical protein
VESEPGKILVRVTGLELELLQGLVPAVLYLLLEPSIGFGSNNGTPGTMAMGRVIRTGILVGVFSVAVIGDPVVAGIIGAISISIPFEQLLDFA